ncbi:MAG TPA: M23 family metallopeptidase [Bacteroidales bacterium]|nr:M23 family metallopeptidase [Bacteroidales bacterium]
MLTTIFFAGLFYTWNNRLETPGIKSLTEQQADILMKVSLLKANMGRLGNILDDIRYNDDNIYRTYFEVDPLPASKRGAGYGGNEPFKIYRQTRYTNDISTLGRDLDIIAKKLVIQSKSYDEVIEMARTKEKRLAARPAIQPISIKDLVRFGSAFGIRMHPILKVRKMHEGIDLTAPRGTRVYATADGTVIQAALTGGGYGNKIMIDHGFGYETLYGHLYKILVEPGQKVKRGDVIGLVGSTGLSAAPHLHYEVIVNGRKVNPINYYANDLSSEEYDHMINLLSMADPAFDIN